MLVSSALPRRHLLGFMVSALFVLSVSPLFPYFLDHLGWNDKRVLQIAICLIATGVVAFDSNIRGAVVTIIESLGNGGKSCIFALLALVMLSSLFAAYPLRSFQVLGLLCALALVGTVLWIDMRHLSRSSWALIISMVFLIVTLMLAISFASYLAVFIQYPANFHLGARERWIPHFSNPRFFNHVQLWCIPLASWCLAMMWKSHRWIAGCLWLSLTFWWLLLFFTLGRGILWAFALSLIFICFLNFRKTSTFAIPVLTTSFAGALLYSLLFIMLPSSIYGDAGYEYVERISDLGDSGRLRLWSVAFELAVGHPVLGVGLQHYGQYSGGVGHAHNMWLNWAAELGVISMMAVVAVAGWLAKKIYGACRTDDTGMTSFVLWQFSSAVIYSSFTGLWITPLSQLLMVFSLIWYIKHLETYRSTLAEESRGSWTSWLVLAVLIANALCMVSVSLHDVLMKPNLLVSREWINNPGFWINGDFFLQ